MVQRLVQQIFTLVPRLNPSLGFVTAQEIQNTTNNNDNNKQRRNLDSGALRLRVIRNIASDSPTNRENLDRSGRKRSYAIIWKPGLGLRLTQKDFPRKFSWWPYVYWEEKAFTCNCKQVRLLEVGVRGHASREILKFSSSKM